MPPSRLERPRCGLSAPGVPAPCCALLLSWTRALARHLHSSPFPGHLAAAGAEMMTDNIQDIPLALPAPAPGQQHKQGIVPWGQGAATALGAGMAAGVSTSFVSPAWFPCPDPGNGPDSSFPELLFAGSGLWPPGSGGLGDGLGRRGGLTLGCTSTPPGQGPCLSISEAPGPPMAGRSR